MPAAFGPYLRRNAGVALELATLAAGARPGEDAARAAFAEAQLNGRFEFVAGDPPLIFDAAHNRDGAAALAEALRPLAAESPAVVCVSVLADKDAAGIAAELAPLAEVVVCTAADPGPAMGRPGPSRSSRSSWRPPSPLLEPNARSNRTRSPLAGGDRSCPSPERVGGICRLPLPFEARMDREARSELLSMMGLVAVVVAGVILVFFGLGYLFGRLFL